MKTVAIAGLELAPSGVWAWTFLNNIITYVKAHKYDDIKVIDARDHAEAANPMASLWSAVKKAHDKTDLVIYSGHSSPINLLVFYHCQIDLPNSHRYIGVDYPWDIALSDKAQIILWGCQTAGVKGVKSENSIAQAVANTTKRSTFGFVWRSSQKKHADGYYQEPERGGLVECTPNCHVA